MQSLEQLNGWIYSSTMRLNEEENQKMQAQTQFWKAFGGLVKSLEVLVITANKILEDELKTHG